MKRAAKSIALATLVLLTTGPSHAEPLRSTSIPSSLADDEKRLLPEVMSEFYGAFNKAKACWMSKHKDGEYENTYCMKPVRLDVIKSTGRKMLFIVAGGHLLDEEGEVASGHALSGGLGLIVLTPNGANLGVVATNDLYEWFGTYNRIPEHDTVTIHRLGPNETYGWIAKSGEDHSGREYRWAKVYAVIGHSVEPLTTITSYYSNAGACGPDSAPCTTLSVKYTFETQASASSFYPILLRVSGVTQGRPFRGNYRLVFDKNSLTYLAPRICPTILSRTLSSRCRIRGRSPLPVRGRRHLGPTKSSTALYRWALSSPSPLEQFSSVSTVKRSQAWMTRKYRRRKWLHRHHRPCDRRHPSQGRRR